MEMDTQARTLAMQGAANRFVGGLLRTPLLCRLAGRRLIVLHLVGRKTGREFDVPVAYTRDGDELLVGTQFGWKHNLRTGTPVQILLKGKHVAVDVDVITDENGVVAAYALMARDNHQFARFNRIALDGSGEPDRADLHRAWTTGARAFRLRPRVAVRT